MAPPRILIVEDEPLIARNLQQILSAHHYPVTGLAFDATEAFDKLAQRNADLVLLDINLNGHFSGLDIAEAIYHTYKIPFLFITSYADEETLAKAKTFRPVGYVVKPFTAEEIYAAIEIGWFNASQRNDVMSIEQLNEQTTEPLTKKEFEILQDLVKGIPYKEIADTHFVSLNTVNTHIKNIYSKFGLHSRGTLTEYIRKLTS